MISRWPLTIRRSQKGLLGWFRGMEKDFKLPTAGPTITNGFIPFSCHCEPEALHRMVYRAKGVAISSFLGLRSLFRSKRVISEFASALPRNRFTPRNDKLFNVFVLILQRIFFRHSRGNGNPGSKLAQETTGYPLSRV